MASGQTYKDKRHICTSWERREGPPQAKPLLHMQVHKMHDHLLHVPSERERERETERERERERERGGGKRKK